MPLTPEYDKIIALLAELRILSDHAHARSNLLTDTNGFAPEYWLGVASGYDETVKRLEVLLKQ